jgi:hypothetical protein
LFRYCQGVIYFNAQVSDGTFDLGMSKQKLNGPEISGPPAVVPVSRSVPGLLLSSAQATARVAPHMLSAPRAIDLMVMAALLTAL